ncbi:MAG: Sip1-related alpha-galactosidase, partial [Armatimonadota bacterium]
AFGDDPYELVARCVERGMAVTGRPGKLRFEKPLPEIWNSIGWCTWNAMYSGVNEKDVLTKLREFRAEAFPVQYVLIDDGWSPLDGRELASFDINIEKFPSGLKGFVNTVKSDFNVQQVGFWHAFTGYWQGVSTKSPLYSEQKDNLLKTKRGSHIPYPEAQKSFGFWNGWHSHLRQQGVDFVKVDNQGATWHHSRGTMPVGDAAKGQQYGLQASIGLNFSDRVINCMCMANDCIWHWTSSNVARNSDDFFPDSLPSHCEHARQNIYNNLFYANFAWPDWDMFWSYHPQATYHAALRAISGGPVYFTDEVGKANWDILRPFITTNGHLLKCPQPAMPTRDTLFVNPYEDKKPVKAFNTVGDAGMVLAVNALNVEDSVQGDVKPSDVEGLKGDLFAVREYFTGQTRLLGRNDSWPLELGVYEPLLFTFARVDNGLAVIGLANKYVSHAAVQKITMLNNSAVISLAEGGDLLLYLEKPAKAIRTIAGNISGHANEGWMTVPVVSDEPVDVFVEW